MKRWKKVLLIILAVLVLLVGGLCVWQWNNLTAAYTFLTQDSQTIAANLENKREAHRAAIGEEVPLTVAPPSTAQSAAILQGSSSPEAVKEALGITEQLAKTGGEATRDELVNSCVAELYAVQVDVMARLAEMKQETVDQWLALSDAERTDTRKKELGLAGLEQCYGLEGETDDLVREILSRYRAKLKAIGADDGILDTLWSYYSDEKADEKAYYLDKYAR